MADTNGSATHDAGGGITFNEAEMRRFEEVVANAVYSRTAFVNQLFDRRRDIDRECGYPKPEELNALYYQQLYDREGVAARAVQVLPRESWQVQPSVYEDENPDTETAFEAAWKGLAKSLRGETSRYADEEGNPVWEVLRRADELSGIGHYGVILLGLDDGLPLDQPAAGMEEAGSVPGGKDAQGVPLPGWDGAGVYSFSVNAKARQGRRLLFLRVFPESLASVLRYEANPTSPRFGHPTLYQITLQDPRDALVRGGSPPTATWSVHWTRVIHVADNLESSETFGVPRLRPSLNRVLDLRKLYGGSAEMYWQGALPGYAVEGNVPPGEQRRVSLDTTGLKDMVESYINGLQRWIALKNATVKPLAPQVVDPTPQIDGHLQALCIQIGIPKRVFMGSERGELASSQDDAAWNDRLRQRQRDYVTPRVVVPFVDRLIQLGVLPEPGADGYHVDWPDLTSQSRQEQADVAWKETQALALYVTSGAEAVVPPTEYLTGWLCRTEKETSAIIEAAVQAEEDQAAEEARNPPPAPPVPPQPPAPGQAGAAAAPGGVAGAAAGGQAVGVG